MNWMNQVSSTVSLKAISQRMTPCPQMIPTMMKCKFHINWHVQFEQIYCIIIAVSNEELKSNSVNLTEVWLDASPSTDWLVVTFMLGFVLVEVFIIATAGFAWRLTLNDKESRTYLCKQFLSFFFFFL